MLEYIDIERCPQCDAVKERDSVVYHRKEGHVVIEARVFQCGNQYSWSIAAGLIVPTDACTQNKEYLAEQEAKKERISTILKAAEEVGGSDWTNYMTNVFRDFLRDHI